MILLLAGLPLFACDRPPADMFAWMRPSAEPPEVASADTAFTPIDLVQSSQTPTAAPPVRNIDLSVLHVKIPRSAAGRIENIWNHLREDVIDADTSLHLRRNGIRVGSGHTEGWDAIRAIVDAVPEARVNKADPVRMPQGAPLDLELDLEPADRTIFYLERDGVLSGADIPQGRKSLRLAQWIDRRHSDRVWISIVPQVRQLNEERRWVRTPAGLVEASGYGGRVYPSVGFSLELGPGEFCVIAAGEKSDISGLIGSVFLTEPTQEGPLLSYIFVRPSVEEIKPQS